VNGAVLPLLRRLGVELGLRLNPAGSEARPCRAGQLYRVDLVGKLIYFAETGQRDKFEARREVLLTLAATWR
jgi:hypothetical protein